MDRAPCQGLRSGDVFHADTNGNGKRVNGLQDGVVDFGGLRGPWGVAEC